jgi:hypothetical protein
MAEWRRGRTSWVKTQLACGDIMNRGKEKPHPFEGMGFVLVNVMREGSATLLARAYCYSTNSGGFTGRGIFAPLLISSSIPSREPSHARNPNQTALLVLWLACEVQIRRFSEAS